MKQTFTLILGLLMITAVAQTDVLLRIEHTMGGEPLEFEQTYTHPDLGYDFNITRLQYYVSEIDIVHDGGQTTPIEETWLLVDAEEQKDYSLGSHSITNVEGISFYVGVDHGHNHLDPTSFPAGHPLAPQDPSMHWGWAAGYRFVCLEGETGAGLFFMYQIHALGDMNYWQTSLPTAALWEDGDLVITIQADYFGMLDGIDVSSGMIEHGDTGPPATLLVNFSEEVYSQLLFTGTPENLFEQSVSLYPNPSYYSRATVHLNLTEKADYELVVTSLSGQVVMRHHVAEAQSVELNLEQNGMYFVQLWGQEGLLHTEKLVIAQ